MHCSVECFCREIADDRMYVTFYSQVLSVQVTYC